MEDKYDVVIGLEVHAQLLTQSKLFCGDSTFFGSPPNTQVSVISLAHPGTLPRLNKKAIDLAIKLGLALNCDIQENNYFARKNYLYPDLPKGYQVSQHSVPICLGGWVIIQSGGGERKVKLNRIHLEEDAGKSIHDADPAFTCIDLNRAGIPLLEIVTEPDLFSAEEAYAFLTELRRMLRWLDVCDGNMEEGSMRCDANISVKLKTEKVLGTRVEVKNLNSIRNVKKAIEFEKERLISILEKNEKVIQQTRSFDADQGTTFALRTKEEADDYRYFPEPDLPPVYISSQYKKEIQETLPPLPHSLYHKYVNDWGLTPYDASIICSDKEEAEYFESLLKFCKHQKAVANWLIGPVRSKCTDLKISVKDFPLGIEKLAALINLAAEGRVSFQNASGKILSALLNDPSLMPSETAASLNLLQESDSNAIEEWVAHVINSMPDKVSQYKSGKKGLLGLFAGEVKRLSKGKADMDLVNKCLLKNLDH